MLKDEDFIKGKKTVKSKKDLKNAAKSGEEVNLEL